MYGPVPQFNPGPRLAEGAEWTDHAKEWAHRQKERGQDWAGDKKARATSHGQSVYSFLSNKNGSQEELGIHWLYFICKVLATVATVFLLVLLIMVGSTTILADNTDSQVYVTNTFYTSNDNEQNVSWMVLTSSPWNNMPRPNNGASYGNIQFEHFYECMWVSQQGYGLCNSSAVTASVAAYTTCLNSNYAAQLSTCAPAPLSANSALIWPTSNVYSQCINSGLSNNVLWNLNALRTCIREDLWPLYDVPQDVTTTYFLGAYSWPLLVVTSLFLFFVFALYTVYPVDWEDATVVEYGKPKSSFVRLGMLWAGLALLFTALWIVVVLLISFRTNGAWPNNNTNYYPSTQQTNVIMVVSTFTVFFYFLFEGAEFWDRDSARNGYRRLRKEKGQPELPEGNGDNPWAYGAKIPTAVTMTAAVPVQVNPMGYYFPVSQDSIKIDSIDTAGHYYTPVLTQTWADAYLLDPIFMTGLVGATLQVYTSDVYNIFFGILFYRIVHTSVARVVYHSYVYVHLIHENQPKDEAVSATKVLGLATHVAGLCGLIVPIYIVFDSTRMYVEFPIVTNAFILCYIIPEALRFLGHVALSLIPERSTQNRGVYILVLAQFIWTWDLFVRGVLLYLLLWGNAGSRGTKPYLLSGLQSITAVLQLP